jgi:hypothetical protein
MLPGPVLLLTRRGRPNDIEINWEILSFTAWAVVIIAVVKLFLLVEGRKVDWKSGKVRGAPKVSETVPDVCRLRWEP